MSFPSRIDPRISVLTPSYNYGHVVVDCIRSVQSQQPEAEHVIVDDASDDDSVARIRASGASVRLRTLEANQGQAATLNLALAEASGDWVCWLPADDFLLPTATGSLRRTLANSPEADVVYGDTVFVDDEGAIRRLLPQHGFSSRVLRWYGTFLTPGSTFVRRSVLDAGPWDPSLRQLLDWDLWLRLTAQGARFVYVGEPMSAFRRHRQQLSSNVTATDRREWNVVRERYGMPDGWRRPMTSTLGHLEHATRKLWCASYRRQLAVQKQLRGRSLRWYAEELGRETFLELIEIYDRTRGGTSWHE